MCGIVGIRRFDKRPVELELLKAMTSRLTHRGPDAEGFWIDGSLGFGHRRLSIIDLQGSVQPMSSADGRVHLTFNGEILNYRDLRKQFRYPFQTDGDTETILASYASRGEDGIAALEGQFALGLFDAASGSLILARDRMGILPLYYYVDSTFLAFASEIKALLPVMASPSVDLASLDAYLGQRAVAAPYTMFEGVRKLPPAHLMRVGETGIEHPKRYWRYPDVSPSHLSPSEAVDKLDSILNEAVETTLVADVPVGAYLSGGVDSSLIVALMSRRRKGERIKTFSAGFGSKTYDELPFAREVSQLVGTDHHEVTVTPEEFRGLWPRLTWHRDAPISEPADIAVFRLAELARRSVTVVLSGEGSDELFGGYPKHRFAGLTAAAGLLPASVRGFVLGRLADLLPSGASRLRIAFRAISESGERERFGGWFAPFTAAERGVLIKGVKQHPRADWLFQPDGDALRRMLMLDAQTWLPDNLLERGDRMSMAASIELRPPFLDRRVVEFAFSTPSDLKIREGRTKWLVKSVARRYLPESIVDRRKVGFRVPLDEWFRGSLETFAWDTLCASGSFASAYLEQAFVRRLLERHRSGRFNEEIRIWTLLCLEMWYQEFFVNRSRQSA